MKSSALLFIYNFRMRKIKIVDLSRVFSNGGSKLEWGKIGDAFIYNGNKKKFDFMYSMHESFWHFESSLSDIIKKWNKTGKMSDPDFIFTALAYGNAVEKLKKEFFNNLQLGKLKINLGDVIKKSLIFNDHFNWNDDSLFILEKLGCFSEVEFKRFEGKVNRIDLWLMILKNIRNKLVHPNSREYSTIHISGNYAQHGEGVNEEIFEFKSSFSNDISFSVRKDIFLLALNKIEQWCRKNIDKWNQEINNIIIKGVKQFCPEEKYVEKVLGDYVSNKTEEDPIMCERYDLQKMFLAATLLNNNDMKLYVVKVIQAENIFKSSFNYNFWRSKYGTFDLSKERWDFIRKFSPFSPGYASEKIGYWSEEESRRSFPKLFREVEMQIGGGERFSFNTRIIAICAKSINWEKHLIEISKDLDIWKAMSSEEINIIDF